MVDLLGCLRVQRESFPLNKKRKKKKKKKKKTGILIVHKLSLLSFLDCFFSPPFSITAQAEENKGSCLSFVGEKSKE